jgi:hypothetical protein
MMGGTAENHLYGSATSTLCGSRDIAPQQAAAFIIDELDMGML